MKIFRSNPNFFWRDWPIGVKVGVGFGVILLFVVGLAVTGFLNLALIQGAVDVLNEGLEIKAQSDRIQNALFAARREEQAFLLEWEQIGYDEAVNKHLIPHGNQMTDIRLSITRLEKLIAHLDESAKMRTNVETDLENLSRALEKYRSNFNEVAALLRDRGTGNTGIVGKIDQVSADLETQILRLNDPAFLSSYLRLRLNEQRYRLRGDILFRRRVTEAIIELRSLTIRSGPLAEPINQSLTDYGETFSKLVQIDAQIQQHTRNYTVAVDKIQPLAVKIAAAGSRLADESLQNVTENTARARAGLLLVVVVFLVSGSLLSIVLTRQISGPILMLAQTAQKIRYGNLDVPLPPAGQDEIGVLTRTFQEMIAQLKQSFMNLEDRVADRTRRLEIVAQLGEHLSGILNLDELLKEVVNQVQESFGYYHAHIYLLNEEQARLVVAAGTGVAGEKMKARGHSIPFNSPTSLVARAARTGEIVNVNDVHQAPDWLPNPLLPDTRSEMAVPIVLRTENQVVGVLDVQSDKIGGFDESDANLLRSLANQVAVAINNARLFTEVEDALAQARAAQERYIEEAWTKLQPTPQRGFYHFARPGAPELPETVHQQVKQQVQGQARPVTVPLSSDAMPQDNEKEKAGASQQAIAAPVRLHNKQIGVIEVYPSDQRQTWSEDELAIIQAVVDELAQTAENLRLFEETRLLATREHLTRQITDKMRASPDMQSIIQTGLRELAAALGVPRVYVRLKTGEETSTSSSPNGGPKQKPQTGPLSSTWLSVSSQD